VSLQLSGAAITDAWIRKLPDLKMLKGLRLYKTSVTDEGLADLSKSESLTHLSLTYCKRTGVNGLKSLRHLSGLREIHLVGATEWSDGWGFTKGHWVISDEALAAIREHPSIEDVMLVTDAVTPAGLRAISDLKHLRRLVAVFPAGSDSIAAATKWRSAEPRRELYLRPDIYLEGWMDGLEGWWVRVRGYRPDNAR
jgi:hypothetical protein